jgi:hypothetical protein
MNITPPSLNELQPELVLQNEALRGFELRAAQMLAEELVRKNTAHFARNGEAVRHTNRLAHCAKLNSRHK